MWWGRGQRAWCILGLCWSLDPLVTQDRAGRLDPCSSDRAVVRQGQERPLGLLSSAENSRPRAEPAGPGGSGLTSWVLGAGAGRPSPSGDPRGGQSPGGAGAQGGICARRARADLTRGSLLPAVPGPCDHEDLLDGVLFGAKYLGSTQLLSERNPPPSTRMAQAQEAVDRVKVRGTRGRPGAPWVGGVSGPPPLPPTSRRPPTGRRSP